MIDFNKEYQTRDGRKVRLISNQGSKIFPIIGIIQGSVTAFSWTSEGRCFEDTTTSRIWDLMEVTPEPKIYKCWVNFYSDGSSHSFSTRGSAEICKGSERTPRVGDPIEITWREE